MELNKNSFPRSRGRARSPRRITFKMERSFILGVVILIVLIAFTQGSPLGEENDPDLVSRDSLLEKLGMELRR